MILQAEHPVQGTAPNDNVNAAIPASRGQRMDCTLKAVECVSCTIHGHFERLVVVVSAGFAGRGGAARLPPIPISGTFLPSGFCVECPVSAKADDEGGRSDGFATFGRGGQATDLQNFRRGKWLGWGGRSEIGPGSEATAILKSAVRLNEEAGGDFSI
jgi:hypothetical protein